MNRRTRRLPLVLVLAAVAVSIIASASHAAPPAWRDWTAGLKESNNSNKPVLVDVYTDWCGWCKRMDADVYTRADVRDYLAQHFVTVRMNAESAAPVRYEGKPYTLRSLASRFRVNGYPTTIFLRPSGEHIANVPGYPPADQFLILLHYIGEGQLDRGVSYDDYVKQQTGQQ